MENKHHETSEFPEHFTPELVIQSPGRINVIGEHTDYNNGFVFPTAIDKGLQLAFRKNPDPKQCRVYSRTNGKAFSFELNRIARSSHTWENYILGVIVEIQKLDKQLQGFDCVIDGNLPIGSGLSSSAALEGGIAFGLNELFSLGLSRLSMAELSRNAEHHYVGMQCGIMDQYSSLLSRENSLMMLDCKNLETKFASADFEDYQFLLLDSKVSHNLAESEYNVRRQQCEAAVTYLQKSFPEVQSLRDVSLEMLEKEKWEMPEELYKRAGFVVEENARVLSAFTAVNDGNFSELGQLMSQSHYGLRDQYEVSCREIDFLVEISEAYPGVLGARIMGGGFGGCSINLIDKKQVNAFVRDASAAYLDEFGIELQAIIAKPSAGTRILKKEEYEGRF